jgi:hypothetical protein
VQNENAVTGWSGAAPSDFERGYVLGQIAAYCEQVRTGCKLAATLQIRHAHVSCAAEFIATEECRSEIENAPDGAVVLWIYKYPFVGKLIRDNQRRDVDAPPDAASVWSAGKLFGYSDYEIARYLGALGLCQMPLREDFIEYPVRPFVGTEVKLAGREPFSLVHDDRV